MDQEKSTLEHTAEQMKATVHDAVSDTMAAADRTTNALVRRWNPRPTDCVNGFHKMVQPVPQRMPSLEA